VGWHDPNYASRRFRQYFAESPAGYRARLRARSAQSTPGDA
jgi:AraC family transcriptional regulator, L-rhamnose operon transcriptional activator RhaR